MGAGGWQGGLNLSNGFRSSVQSGGSSLATDLGLLLFGRGKEHHHQRDTFASCHFRRLIRPALSFFKVAPHSNLQMPYRCHCLPRLLHFNRAIRNPKLIQGRIPPIPRDPKTQTSNNSLSLICSRDMDAPKTQNRSIPNRPPKPVQIPRSIPLHYLSLSRKAKSPCSMPSNMYQSRIYNCYHLPPTLRPPFLPSASFGIVLEQKKSCHMHICIPHGLVHGRKTTNSTHGRILMISDHRIVCTDQPLKDPNRMISLQERKGVDAEVTPVE